MIRALTPSCPDLAPAVVIVAAVLVLVHLAAHGMLPALRYERAAVLDGEVWRLVTGHVVHADLRHLGWNVLGVLIVWGLVRARLHAAPMARSSCSLRPRRPVSGSCCSSPGLEWYVGFSGVLHGCMAAGLVAWLRSVRDPLTWLVAGLFAAKLAWEHLVGALPFTGGSLSIPVVHEAHTYGAVGGLLAALVLSRRTRPAAASL